MTESEAKEKWCPFSRQVFVATYGPNFDAVSASGNRDKHGKASSGSLCLGSVCMAWHKEGHCLLIGRAIPFTWEDRRLEAEKNA